MKYVIVIPDGCADEPVESLGGLTPLQAAKLPNMDRIAKAGVVGLANNVPASLTPASDVATLSLFGYDPLKVYTGRAPLETAAMGIHLGPNDWAIRCNLVNAPDGHMRRLHCRAHHQRGWQGTDSYASTGTRWKGTRWRHTGISRGSQLPQYPCLAWTLRRIAIRWDDNAAAPRHPRPGGCRLFATRIGRCGPRFAHGGQ